jgi:hypothetical protein
MYIRLLSRTLSGARVRVLACALMTNHIHAAVIPERSRSGQGESEKLAKSA